MDEHFKLIVKDDGARHKILHIIIAPKKTTD